MGVAALVRKAFADAQTYAAEARPRREEPRSTKRSIPALEGKIPVYFAAHRKDDIPTALRIAAEFKLKPVIALGTEAYRMADELKKAGVPVVVHPTMQRAGVEHGDAALVHRQRGGARRRGRAGHDLHRLRGLRAEDAGAAPRGRDGRRARGLDQDRALRAVTIDAAKLLGIDKEYGSIEKGKVADLVLYDGDPFEHATHVTQTIMARQGGVRPRRLPETAVRAPHPAAARRRWRRGVLHGVVTASRLRLRRAAHVRELREAASGSESLPQIVLGEEREALASQRARRPPSKSSTYTATAVLPIGPTPINSGYM